MARKVYCDLCNEGVDDCDFGSGPVFAPGAELRTRETGNDDFVDRLDVCPACLAKIVEMFPKTESRIDPNG